MAREANGRMLNRNLSESQRFASLCPKSAALFCMLIPHLNAHGKMQAEPYTIKGVVCPLVEWLSMDEIAGLLAKISLTTNLKFWKADNGLHYLHSINWDEHQKLEAIKRGTDKLPNYPGDSNPANDFNLRVVDDNSTSSLGVVVDESQSSRGEVESYSDTKYKDKTKDKDKHKAENECDSLLVREGYAYATKYPSVNLHNYEWVRGYLETEGPSLMETTGLSEQNLLACWREAVDLAVSNHISSLVWYKSTFKNRVAQFKPGASPRLSVTNQDASARDALRAFTHARHVMTGELFPLVEVENHPTDPGILYHMSNSYPVAMLEGFNQEAKVAV
jgi:hypothetical protein